MHLGHVSLGSDVCMAVLYKPAREQQFATEGQQLNPRGAPSCEATIEAHNARPTPTPAIDAPTWRYQNSHQTANGSVTSTTPTDPTNALAPHAASTPSPRSRAIHHSPRPNAGKPPAMPRRKTHKTHHEASDDPPSRTTTLRAVAPTRTLRLRRAAPLHAP